MELESQLEGFKKRGLGVAAISYDSVEILKDFASRRGITFPLLSDPESRVIRAFSLLNEVDYPKGNFAHGVPFPGVFTADARGVVRRKDFEKTYQERRTAASLLTSEGESGTPSVSEIRNAQFTLRTSASNLDVAPGQRVTLILNFEMAPRMHAYAKGAKSYRALNLQVDPHPWVTLQEAVYPDARPYTFEPLNETVPVHDGSFRVLQDVTFLGPPRPAPGAPPSPPVTSLELTATLQYQVCSDTVCYAPSSLRLAWPLKLSPLDRERSPEALRRK